MEVDPNRRLSAIGQALAILGDRWVLLILQRALVREVRTFAGWRDTLPISESVLASRLKDLVGAGMLTPVPHRDGRTRHEYRLTARGSGVWPLIVAIHSWEREWAGRDCPTLIHESCGGEAGPYLACGTCGTPMSARDTETVRGPHATFAGIGLPRRRRRTARPDDDLDALGYRPDSMEILGDRWSTMVLAAALLGTRRFVAFQAELGVAPSVLTDRLRRFVERGVLRQAAGDYRLTEKGLAFFEVCAVLVHWAQEEFTAPPGSGLVITHRPCGAALTPVLACAVCDRPLHRRDVRFPPPPLGTAAGSAGSPAVLVSSGRTRAFPSPCGSRRAHDP
ncbi:winged helix-turn-helix transcriptional regulator [Planotetraspora kaengkrachanensis]|uniref:HxlR family transcriptional regulator n=1 Tax=Planotetraspora kaengkrachanensis TaxID=575193 RepID=A0A8J3PVC9_9ACTN|nr:helix-turn-helix domain-containing protein [Planotetraspora kaengkrachanensis]GIG81781.1 HxlR family transcriptional regulator [Planotetraspora kaengkrachanensis]